MMDFHQQFNNFNSTFGTNRSLIVAMKSIKANASKQLNKKYSKYIRSQTLLSRLHYITHSSRDFTLDYLQLPLKGIETVTIQQSLKLLKSNQKDRYSYAIYFLKEKPTLLAQILYFSFLTPGNESLPSLLKNAKPFTEDDIIFFCFSTFPAMYNHFSTEYDQISAISLIKSLFELHLSLHGPNFGQSHKFLSYLISSFFLATNPGSFFESSLKPLLRQNHQQIHSIRYTYKMIEGLLIRIDYWEFCLIFTFQLLEEMCKNIPLLPKAARLLITEISKIKTDGFPFAEFFIFEPMFCNYLENMLLSNNVTFLRDVCNVIRFTYPYGIIKTAATPILKIISKKHNFSEMLAFPSRIQKFKLEAQPDPETDPMTLSISKCDRKVIYTTRDFYLIRNSIELFLEFSDEDKTSELQKVFAQLIEPKLINEDQFFEVDPWADNNSKAKSKPSEKVFLEANKAFNLITDCLSTINNQKMTFKTVDELSSQTLNYCGLILNNMERITIANISSDFKENGEGMKEAQKRVQNGIDALKEASDELFTSIFMIKSETERHNEQVLNLLSLLIQWKILPLMNELFPNDFNFNSRDIFEAADSANALTPVFRAIETHIDPLKLPPKHDELIKKGLILMYLDQIDNMYDYQKTSVNVSLQNKMRNYVQKMPDTVFKSGRFSKTIAKKAMDLFKAINGNFPPSANTAFVIGAFGLLKNFKTEDIGDLILRHQNISVFGFYNFLRSYVKNEKLLKMIFTDDEAEYIRRFISICISVRTKILK